MDTVAVVLSAARRAERVTLRMDVEGHGNPVQFDVVPKSFAESFARAGLRPGDASGFVVLEALHHSCILEVVKE